MTITIRPAAETDWPAMLAIVKPVLDAGETYAIDTDLGDDGVRAYWLMPAHEVFVAEIEGRIAGTYYLMANQAGGTRQGRGPVHVPALARPGP